MNVVNLSILDTDECNINIYDSKGEVNDESQ